MKMSGNRKLGVCRLIYEFAPSSAGGSVVDTIELAAERSLLSRAFYISSQASCPLLTSRLTDSRYSFPRKNLRTTAPNSTRKIERQA